ncbi:peptide deformylase [Rubellicoccus peritrichatus]|uniref:Peptide deformylase n=1 Tax=Rubellicoccus peritrichatus TaxID=3080537 RepID=A0AAQ3QW76_9BACT|nr:peptide deformylase [Puniceicoccus sp. CR14]WOO41625.1 peptide deformylase [Puniceicoccus sp. CR14]
MRVTQFGEPVLKQAGKKVEVFDEALKKLSEDMFETMYAEEGIGLAAQQIDKAIQMFVIDLCVREKDIDFSYTLDGRTPPLELIMPMVMINPEIETSGEELPYEEGCLSFPGIRGNVIRPSVVRVKYQDITGQSHDLECDGIFARVILHENDHIEGTLFIERMHPDVLRPLESKLKKLKRKTRDFLKRRGG